MSMARVEGLRIGDRFDIEQLMYKYCKAADMADAVTQADLFHEDCRVRYSGTEWIEGRASLLASLQKAFTRYKQTSHAVTNISIEFQDTDYATAESLITAWHRNFDGAEWTLHGRYIDSWKRDRHGWRLQTREIIAAGAENRDEASLNMIQRLVVSDGH